MLLDVVDARQAIERTPATLLYDFDARVLVYGSSACFCPKAVAERRLIQWLAAPHPFKERALCESNADDKPQAQPAPTGCRNNDAQA